MFYYICAHAAVAVLRRCETKNSAVEVMKAFNSNSKKKQKLKKENAKSKIHSKKTFSYPRFQKCFSSYDPIYKTYITAVFS